MQFFGTVIFNKELTPGYWHMRLAAPAFFAQAEPGQFVMVRVSAAIDPLLRRPLAVFDAGMLPPEQAARDIDIAPAAITATHLAENLTFIPFFLFS